MWRWVTRGLVLTLLTALSIPALFAQLPTGFIGVVDHPDPTVTHSGVVLVKGWAYDPLSISRIELWVDDQYQHNVVMGLPFIDVIEAYPQYPGLHHEKVGFQTGFLASRFPSGPHTVELRAVLSNGQVHDFGRRTVQISNGDNQSPFGSVDQPDASGTYNGTGVIAVVGWAADADGIQRVDVQLDGGNMMSAMYGDARPDVGAAFPDFPAALFSGWIANLDTTRVTDGVHTLTITATDRLGMTKLIGRRMIQVLNSTATLRPFGYLDEPKRDATLIGTVCGGQGVPGVSPFVRTTAHLTPVRGWALDLGTRTDTGRISYVELLIDGERWTSTDDCSFILGGLANCYGLPRFDVQRYYPTYPDAPNSGFNFLIDVGALISKGVRQGSHTLKVRVGDMAGTFAELPGPAGIPVTFKCAELTQDFPVVGFIDQPTTFDYVTGNVTFQGWALDSDNLVAVEIIVDGNYVGQAQYGFPRSDVAQQYPQFFTAGTSGWRFVMDTTKLSNARHRLTVRVLDGRGNRDLIGSVDFYVYNNTTTP
jgi:hypothetical protein